MELYGARTDVEHMTKRDALAAEAETRHFERAARILEDLLDFLKLARLELELLERERHE
jgi:hypothetical protein